jgi:serine phosphatase RsbU (regulator of sigma subunit)
MSESNINKFRFNNLTLKFYDKAVETDFRKSCVVGSEKTFRWTMLVAGFFYVFSGIIDYSSGPEIYIPLYINRGVFFVFVLLFYGLTFTKYFNRYYFIIIVSMFVVSAAGAIHGMALDPVYLGSIYSVIVFFTLLPFLTLRLVVITNFLLLIILTLVLTYFTNYKVDDVFKHVAFLIVYVFLNLVVCYIKQSIERKNYIKKHQNKEARDKIETQFNELEVSHEKITDSINYAKRIQDALLPKQQDLDALPLKMAVFNKPKDIIGGDFYWVHEVNDKIVIAVGDCTGHGVPGAIMTSLGINGLINAVSEQAMTSPSEILTYLDDYIHGLLTSANSNESTQDGMEMAVVSIDLKANQLIFAGAGRPLIVIEDGAFIETKGSRRDIGSKFISSDFVNHVFEFKKGLSYYLFSDGMTDQFGGLQKRRLGKKKFYNLLTNIKSTTASEKNNEIELFYNDYAKEANQTDDMICLLVEF